MKKLFEIGLRQQALFIPQAAEILPQKELSAETAALVAYAIKLGYTFEENLLHLLNATSAAIHADILDALENVTGVKKNWTPLVKGWNIPTQETALDHFFTWFASLLKSKNGTTLECGHVIPAETFPLQRYNGCPFCGTLFESGEIEVIGQGTKLKTLVLWQEADFRAFMQDLLTSKTALDGTQVDSLKTLLKFFPIPDVKIEIKETLMTLIDHFVGINEAEKVQGYFKNPNDILRYLWFKKTGFLQVIAPKTLMKQAAKANVSFHRGQHNPQAALNAKQAELKLKYSRKEGLMVANWLNGLPLSAEQICEQMHPKREMWIRFIRALRLAEYAKRKDMGKLQAVLDLLYHKAYPVWEGSVQHYRLKADATQTLNLLKQRPGLFARSLFANMLWFGAEDTLAAFSTVLDQVPARLLFTLNMYADTYFDRNQQRIVKPLGGKAKRIGAHPLLQIYNDEALDAMKKGVAALCITAMKKRFSGQNNPHKSIFIDSQLFQIPVAIGDRSETVQDVSGALQGTRFLVEGDKIRLFMQWGVGFNGHFDMDLSAQIVYDNHIEYCSYSNLSPVGCQHSGDVQYVTHKSGAAEYIEIDLPVLAKAGAKYVSFTCNAYSGGGITSATVLGWMNTNQPMHISKKTGVAYDPSCVQHQVRVTQLLSRGLVFGVLDLESWEIIWLEMPFGGQTAMTLDANGISAYLKKLKAKLTIGELLKVKAEAQNLILMDNSIDADEVYDMAWARNSAAVTKLLID